MHQLSGQISTKTGFAPKCTIGETVAIQFVSANITSLPGLIPIASKPMCIAPVQLEVAMQCLTPK